MVRDWSAFIAAGAGICFAIATASPNALVEAPRAVALAMPVSVPWIDDLGSAVKVPPKTSSSHLVATASARP